MLLLLRKHTSTLIEQKRSCPQETPEFKLKEQTENFSLNPPINLFEEGKWLVAVTSFKTTNSVYMINDGKNTISIGTPGYCGIPNYLLDGIIDKLKKLLEVGSKNATELHFKEVQKGTLIEIANSGQNFASFDHFKSELFSEFKRVKDHDLYDMVFRMEITYGEIMDKLDLKSTSATPIAYTLPYKKTFMKVVILY